MKDGGKHWWRMWMRDAGAGGGGGGGGCRGGRPRQGGRRKTGVE